jgi:multidrug resistance efflux pump
MSVVETKSKREAAVESPAAVWSPAPTPRERPSRRRRILPALITLATLAVAVVLGRAMWDAYMGAPWTRDGTVRAYVVTMAPQVAGQIVQLPVVDNRFVHEGDLLMVIDPTNFKIAVSLAEAAVEQAQVTARNVERQAKRRQELTTLAVTVEEKEPLQATRWLAKPNCSRPRPIWIRRG